MENKQTPDKAQEEIVYENIPGTGMLLKGKLKGNQSEFAEYKLKENVLVPLFSSIWVQFPGAEYLEMMDATGREIAWRYNEFPLQKHTIDSQAKELTRLQQRVEALEAERDRAQLDAAHDHADYIKSQSQVSLLREALRSLREEFEHSVQASMIIQEALSKTDRTA